MMGTVRIADLEVTCVVGVLPEERTTPQTIYLDVALDWDFAAAAESDDVHHTVDYTEVSEELTALLQERRFKLIETMAERCCERIFQRWPKVSRCRLTVKKPGAIALARHAAVSLERRRA